tara:strand:- start:95 stop:346 length:252 start_codon:yes stop_codon:yes gene_type:complete
MLNLPDAMLDQVVKIIIDKLDQSPQGYLKNSYENLLKYYTTTKWDKNIKKFYYNLGRMDERRKKNAREIFTELFRELDAYILE